MAGSTEPPFTVSCSGSLGEDGVWVIQASIRFRDGVPPRGSRLLGEGRLALLEAITSQLLCAVARSARSVRLFLDQGDGIVSEIDPRGVLGRSRRQ